MRSTLGPAATDLDYFAPSEREERFRQLDNMIKLNLGDVRPPTALWGRAAIKNAIQKAYRNQEPWGRKAIRRALEKARNGET